MDNEAVVNEQATETVDEVTKEVESTDKVDLVKEQVEDTDVSEEDTVKEQVVPEEYTDFTAPENYEFNDEFLTPFKELAKELELSQENAQRLVDIHTKNVAELADQLANEFDDTMVEWAKESRIDKEFGGQKFNENLGVARSVLQKWGTPELNELITNTGIGNNKEFLRLLYRIGKDLKDGNTVTMQTKPNTEVDIAKILYPSMDK